MSGEHGIGVDKVKSLPLQFAPADLDFMARLRRAFDPDGIMNPGKILPSRPACGEAMRPGGPAAISRCPPAPGSRMPVTRTALAACLGSSGRGPMRRTSGRVH